MRYLPALLLVLVAAAPFPLAGCDMIAKMRGGDDAGSDAAIVALPAVDAAAAAATDAGAAATPTGTAPPLPTGTVTGVRPVVKADGGVADASVAPVVDAGAPKTDGGPAPTPTPTFTIPTNLFDGGFRFDAGGFKPPPFPK
jgi:hypothetical protein